MRGTLRELLPVRGRRVRRGKWGSGAKTLQECVCEQQTTLFYQAQYKTAGGWVVPQLADFDLASLPTSTLLKPLQTPKPRGRPKTKRGRGKSDFIRQRAKEMRAETSKKQTINSTDLTADDDDDEEEDGDNDDDDNADEEEESDDDDDDEDDDDDDDDDDDEMPISELTRFRDTRARREHGAAQGFAELPGARTTTR